MNDFHIVPATANDVPLILSLIRELADYEKLLREVTATEETLRESLFGERPAAEALLGYEGDAPVGYQCIKVRSRGRGLGEDSEDGVGVADIYD